MTALQPEQIEWVVNDNAELGVKIGNQFFWLYKGGSLVYEDGAHDDGSPMMWRPVGKREFGECCHPIKFLATGAKMPRRYTDELEFNAKLSFGAPDDNRWRSIKESGPDPSDASEVSLLRAERNKFKRAWDDVSTRYEALLNQLGGTDA